MRIVEIGDFDAETKIGRPLSGLLIEGSEKEVKLAAQTMWGKPLRIKPGMIRVIEETEND